MSSGFTPAEGRAYDAWKTRTPDDDNDEGPCPVCDGITDNGEEDADEDGRYWSWLPCDECKSACKSCGGRGEAKTEEHGLCHECDAMRLADEIRLIDGKWTDDFERGE